MLTLAAIQIGSIVAVISLVLIGLLLSVFLGWIFTDKKEEDK